MTTLLFPVFAVSCHIICSLLLLLFFIEVCACVFDVNLCSLNSHQTENKLKNEGIRIVLTTTTAGNTKNDEWLTSKVSHAAEIRKWAKTERVCERKPEKNRTQYRTKKAYKTMFNTLVWPLCIHNEERVSCWLVLYFFHISAALLACLPLMMNHFSVFVYVCVWALLPFFLVIVVLFDFHISKNSIFFFTQHLVEYGIFLHSVGH